MFCQYCSSPAQSICKCNTLFCDDHFTSHRKSCKIFNARNIEESDLKIFLSMKKKIEKIKSICCDLTLKTRSIIEKIEFLCRWRVSELEKLCKKYSQIMEKGEMKDLEREVNKGVFEEKVLNPKLDGLKEFYNKKYFSEQIEFENVKDAKKKLEEDYGLIIEGHTGWVASVAITHDNKYVVSGGGDNTVRVWNLEYKRQEAVLQGHTDRVKSVAVTQNNKYVVSGGGNNTVRVWNLLDKRQKTIIDEKNNQNV